MKTVKIILILIMAFSLLTACEGSTADKISEVGDGRISVVTTIFPPYDFVREIAGDKVNVDMLLPSGLESHSFDPTPQDIIKIQNCDLFIYTGGESDGWIDGILESMNTSKMRTLKMMECVNTVAEELVEGMEDTESGAITEGTKDRSPGAITEVMKDSASGAIGEGVEDSASETITEGANDTVSETITEGANDTVSETITEGVKDRSPGADAQDPRQALTLGVTARISDTVEYDEHVWTSPKNAEQIVKAITDALCGLDNANAGYYRDNETGYIKQLEELDKGFREITDQSVRKTIIFADRFPFRYFADAYGLDYFAAFPGCATETEPSAATVSFLIDKVKSENMPVVFYTEFSNQRMADIICEDTGAKKLLFHACHNISKTDFQNGEGYISLMRVNEEHLREALS